MARLRRQAGGRAWAAVVALAPWLFVVAALLGMLSVRGLVVAGVLLLGSGLALTRGGQRWRRPLPTGDPPQTPPSDPHVVASP